MKTVKWKRVSGLIKYLGKYMGKNGVEAEEGMDTLVIYVQLLFMTQQTIFLQ